MSARSRIGTALSLAMLLSSCAPERGFVLSVKNTSGARLRNVVLSWDSGSVDLGWLSNESEALRFDNPLPVPSSVTVAWVDESAVAHSAVSEFSLAREDSRRVYLYFTILPDGKVLGRSSYD